MQHLLPQVLIQDIVNGYREWWWDCFLHLLPQAALLVVAATKPPCNSSVSDYVDWGRELHRNFTVKSAYRICLSSVDKTMYVEWKVISKFRDDLRCSICGETLKDASHMFRKCVEARALWPRLIKKEKLNEFFHMELLIHVGQPCLATRLKVNTDGARNSNSGLATCRGVGHDSEGNWCFGFSRALGSCSPLEDELWGMFEGLVTAWSLGYTWIVIEVDCRDAYDMIVHGNPRQLGSSVLPSFMEMQQRHSKVHFRFVRREGNVPIDIMTHLAWQDSPNYHRYMDPPPSVRDALARYRKFPLVVMA
ncbi:hypothetical protein V6N12_019746 [Hibiscus sabdariffa]|uniref:RNase H type-1 domain-containing protein n=1 Tax=Hibiscus sabdariffa TaxID=183260 RepID=A0ABR2APC5_9ROSI